jgi:hypothetical protein
MPAIKTSPLILALLLMTGIAQAQPIESEPLPAPYTLQNETDPMALGGTPPPMAPVEEAAPATPPPGQDSITSSEPAPMTDNNPPPSDEAYPDSIQVPTGITSGPVPSANDYPNNSVSGVVPEDPSKFENKIFCTLKISFTSACCGPDIKTGEKVKSYLDANTDKLTYVRTTWGKEGEFSYCLKINEHKNQAAIYKHLKKLAAEKPNKNAPVTISGKGFEPISTKKKNYRD